MVDSGLICRKSFDPECVILKQVNSSFPVFKLAHLSLFSISSFMTSSNSWTLPGSVLNMTTMGRSAYSDPSNSFIFAV